jgi:hypothetical protein
MRLLTEAGVAATPGMDFGENAPERHMRFAYTTSAARLAMGIERIEQFFRVKKGGLAMPPIMTGESITRDANRSGTAKPQRIQRGLEARSRCSRWGRRRRRGRFCRRFLRRSRLLRRRFRRRLLRRGFRSGLLRHRFRSAFFAAGFAAAFFAAGFAAAFFAAGFAAALSSPQALPPPSSPPASQRSLSSRQALPPPSSPRVSQQPFFAAGFAAAFFAAGFAAAFFAAGFAAVAFFAAAGFLAFVSSAIVNLHCTFEKGQDNTPPDATTGIIQQCRRTGIDEFKRFPRPSLCF